MSRRAAAVYLCLAPILAASIALAVVAVARTLADRITKEDAHA